MKKLVLAVFISGLLTSYGQQTDLGSRIIQWGDEIRNLSMSESQSFSYLHFDGAYYEHDEQMLPHYAEEIAVPSGFRAVFSLSNMVFEELVNSDGFENLILDHQIEIQNSVSYIRKRKRARCSFIPLRRNKTTGEIEKLVSFSVSISLFPERRNAVNTNSSFAQNSVLSTGNWYKISTDRDGVFKLDYSFLQDSLGINPSGIDPRNIRIYGNGGGMLPESNLGQRHDDLAENAIFVSGEADGTFDPEDYVLFYGENPDQWQTAEMIIGNDTFSTFSHSRHIYSNKTYYFLTTSLGPGKRIGSQPSTGASPTHTINKFIDRKFFEEDLTNVVQSGRKWYGDHFDWNNKSGSYQFSFPNLVGAYPLILKTSLVGRSIVGNSGYTVNVNNSFAGSVSFSPVGVQYYDIYARHSTIKKALTGMSSNLTVNITFQPSGADPESEGWLDYISLVGQRQLKMAGEQMGFRDPLSVGTGNVAKFEFTGDSQLEIWETTDPTDVKRQSTSFEGGQHGFILETDTLREFIAFTGNQYFKPVAEGQVANQNLHGNLGQPDYVIVSHPDFLDAANDLADFHRTRNGMDVQVVEISKVYNEFSSGAQDISAIRDMLRMLYLRAGADTSLFPQYLLLFGDASYDFKNIELKADVNTNFIPTYQSVESLDQATTYNSDDFFGFLDDNEGGNINSSSNKIDIGVGRIVASTSQEAEIAVAKIKRYKSKETFGSWRNILTYVADDEDGNTHISDANDNAGYLESNFPVYNFDKIYFDAYEQVSTAGGTRYPAVNTAINNRMFTGSLVLNYVGHGGETGWAHERVLQMNDINSWTNKDKLPLFVTATCSFSRFDNPNRRSAGEVLQLMEDGGTIGLITTVRLVYSNANKALNDALASNLFKPIAGEMPRLGQLLMKTKNHPGLGAVNNRKFTLLGDPALRLNYPEHNIVTTKIDTATYIAGQDTLKALQKVSIQGEVRDQSAQLIQDFNGIVYPTIYDKAKTITTLKNDPDSYFYNYKLQKNIIYKGKASVKDGKFKFEFIVPKDIAYNFGQGKISYYADNDVTDAHGFNTIIVGGTADSVADDNEGPEVKIYMNDEKFVFGGITDDSPLMLVKLSDENGINTAGSAIGHDISGILDDDTKNTLVLNEYYEAALDDYQNGEVKYPLSALKDGLHTVSVKAWDVYNNPGEGYTEFVVASSAGLALDHVLNYPNPFTTYTSFWFEHNKPGSTLDIQVQIFTVSGKLVKTLRQSIVAEGYRVDNINWDGLDDYGDTIGKGVYIYRLHVRSDEGLQASKYEKLVILR